MIMTEEQIQHVPVTAIAFDNRVRRHFDEEKLAGLAESIRQVGIQLPIRVRRDPQGKLHVVDGERRLRGALRAGLQVVPVIVETKELSDADTVQRQLILNCQRADLTPLETAKGLDALMKASGWSASQVAGKLGFSNATVTRLLSLVSLPETIKVKVASGDIPPSAAYELSHVADAEVQAELATRVAAGELTRDGIRAAAAGGKKRPGKPAKSSRVTTKVGPGLSMTVNAAAVRLDGLIQSLDALLAQARKVQVEGADVNAFLKSLRSPAKSKNGGAA